jgi:hypothetical protein
VDRQWSWEAVADAEQCACTEGLSTDISGVSPQKSSLLMRIEPSVVLGYYQFQFEEGLNRVRDSFLGSTSPHTLVRCTWVVCVVCKAVA